MAGTEPPPLVDRAIEAHLHVVHESPVGVAVVRAGRRGQAGAGVLWYPPNAESSGSFRCRLCPPGDDVYVADVFAAEPTELALAGIRRHFAEAHGIQALPAAAVGGDGEDGGRLAAWLAMTPARPAGIVCLRCPQGGERHFFGSPAYGDARRHVGLLQRRPELWYELEGLSAEEQALYLEAWDRKLVRRPGIAGAKRALAALRREQEPPPPRLVELAYRGALLARARSGMGVTQAIREFVALGAENSVALRCELGEHVPNLGPHVEELAPKQFARLVAGVLGSVERSPRTLTTYWQRIPSEEREAAEAEGEKGRGASGN